VEKTENGDTWVVLDDYNRLSSLLEEMDIPEKRRDLTKIGNIRWLNRNLAINNKSQSTKNALDLIRKILKERSNA